MSAEAVGNRGGELFSLSDWRTLSMSCSLWLMALSTRKASHPILGLCLSGGVQIWQQIWNTSRRGKKKESEGQMLVLAAQPYFISLEQRIEADCTYSVSSQVMTVSWLGLYLLPNYYWSLLIRDLLPAFYCNLTKNNVIVIALNSVLHFCFLCRTESSVLHFGQALTCTYAPSDSLCVLFWHHIMVDHPTYHHLMVPALHLN